MKIHIIGASGSGKTYLAKRLAERYGIRHYDLDNIFWDNTAAYGKKRPPEERDRLLSEILSQNSYIVEGVYYKWLDISFKNADNIYVLETARRLCRRRIIRRFIRRKFGLEAGKKETIQSLITLLKWTKKYQSVDMERIKQRLSEFSDKTVYIHSVKEVNEIINEVK